MVLASDIHNNLLTLPTVRHYSEGHLTILDGDFTINGGKIEAPLLKGVATLGDPTVAVSGNHDSPGIMRTLERRGVTVLDHTDGVRTIAGLKLAGFEDPLEFVGKEFPSGLRTGLSFGDIPNGHQRYLDAVQERWQWFKALPERPQVLIVHQEAIGRALANLIWHDDPNGAPLAILVAHTHVQRMDRYGPVTTVNSGTAGAGGVFGAGTRVRRAGADGLRPGDGRAHRDRSRADEPVQLSRARRARDHARRPTATTTSCSATTSPSSRTCRLRA